MMFYSSVDNVLFDILVLLTIQLLFSLKNFHAISKINVPIIVFVYLTYLI